MDTTSAIKAIQCILQRNTDPPPSLSSPRWGKKSRSGRLDKGMPWAKIPVWDHWSSWPGGGVKVVHRIAHTCVGSSLHALGSKHITSEKLILFIYSIFYTLNIENIKHFTWQVEINPWIPIDLPLASQGKCHIFVKPCVGPMPCPLLLRCRWRRSSHQPWRRCGIFFFFSLL